MPREPIEFVGVDPRNVDCAQDCVTRDRQSQTLQLLAYRRLSSRLLRILCLGLARGRGAAAVGGGGGGSVGIGPSSFRGGGSAAAFVGGGGGDGRAAVVVGLARPLLSDAAELNPGNRVFAENPKDPELT